MSVSNSCVQSQRARGGVSTVPSAQFMDSKPFPWFNVQQLIWPFPRTRSPCYSAWGLSGRVFIFMSMGMREPLWGVGTLTTRYKHTTKTMSFKFIMSLPMSLKPKTPLSVNKQCPHTLAHYINPTTKINDVAFNALYERLGFQPLTERNQYVPKA